MKLGIGVAALAGILALGIVLASRFGDDPNLVDSPLLGQPLPDMTFERLNQPGELALADLAGNISVVNFWASWCFPCRAEHPILADAAADYPNANFLGIVFQDRENDARDFLIERGEAYPHVVDPDSRGAINFGVFGIPETYFVDAEGIIVAKIAGELSSGALRDTLNRIVLGERPGARTLGTVQGQPGS